MSKALENMTFDELLEVSQKQEAQISDLQFQLEQLRRLAYGSKRERFISNKEDESQLTLPLDIEQETEPDAWQACHLNVIVTTIQ